MKNAPLPVAVKDRKVIMPKLPRNPILALWLPPDFDNEEVLTIALDEKDDDQDADDHAMVQTTMTLGSDSDEDVVLETRPDNIIPEADEDALFARVPDTLACGKRDGTHA